MVYNRGAWVAQSVERPTLAQVMISQSVSSSPASASVLTARSLVPVFGFCGSLSLCPSPAHALSLSVSKRNVKKNLKIWYIIDLALYKKKIKPTAA